MTEMQTDKSSLSFHDYVEDKSSSRFSKYQDLVIGARNFGDFLKYELLTFFLTNLPGSAGLFLRQKLYGSLFREFGNKVNIGVYAGFRQPKKISIQSGSIIDDLANLSVRGSPKSSIEIGENVFIGRCSEVKAREGKIKIDDFSSIGSNCRITTTKGETYIGKYVFLAAYCYLGAGNHKTERIDIPIAKQGFESKGGIYIGDDTWIGANSVVSDGVTIGKGSVIGACSFVNTDIPEYSVAFGSPAKVYRKRN